MKKDIGKLRESLFATTDGIKVCKAIDTLTKECEKGNVEAKTVLAEYVIRGPVKFHRSYACSTIAEIATESDKELVDVFLKGLRQKESRYWSILGCIKAAGKLAYQPLVEIAKNKSVPLEDRAHAVKCLAVHSKQVFDRQLPSDPGEWKASDLRLDEVEAWAKSGFPKGTGHKKRKRHPSIDNPESELERLVNRLDKKLVKYRNDEQDDANPSGVLVVASKEEMDQAKTLGKMPAIYLDFLKRFSPLNVFVESKAFQDGLQLFGASELLAAQEGYSFNPVEDSQIDEWPEGYIVIGSDGGNPYVLDTTRATRTDAPVLTSEHGTDEWEFEEVADSFIKFLKSLVK